MTSIDYDDIFSDFLGSITDYNILKLTDTEAYELMAEYLNKAVAEPYIARLFSTIEIDDDVQSVDFEMDFVVDDAADKRFVQKVLAKGMLIEWLEPQVRSKINIAQMFGTKEQTFFSQATHLAQLRSLLEDTQLELRKLIRDRGYIYNDYLEQS